MSHLHTTRNPQPENWRYHVHGPLHREPEPNRVAAPLALVVAFLGLVWVAGMVIGS